MVSYETWFIRTTCQFRTILIGAELFCSTRVSNELGAGNARGAKLASKVVMGISLLQATVVASAMLILRDKWGYAFSSQTEIVKAVSVILPLLALGTFMDGIQGVLGGKYTYYQPTHVNVCHWKRSRRSCSKCCSACMSATPLYDLPRREAPKCEVPECVVTSLTTSTVVFELPRFFAQSHTYLTPTFYILKIL